MESLLILTNRMPFPPVSADKERCWRLISFLSQHYRVYLGAFAEDEADAQYVPEVEKVCAEAFFMPLNQLSARIRSIGALIGGRPTSLDYYKNDTMQQWVNYIVEEHKIERMLCLATAMTPYVSSYVHARRIIDFPDINSAKWAQEAKYAAPPFNRLYELESERFAEYERYLARSFDTLIYPTPAEAEYVQNKIPEQADRVGCIKNGIDLTYFSPDHYFDNPYSAEQEAIVFHGRLDIRPNIDAMLWFVDEIFPSVRRERPNASLYIVGSNPTPEVERLCHTAGVYVMSNVKDVRVYLAHAKGAVYPLRHGRGIQPAVLEAMAMALPVVVSERAARGIGAVHGKEFIVATKEESFYFDLVSLLSRESDVGMNARYFMENNFDWDKNFADFLDMLEMQH